VAAAVDDLAGAGVQGATGGAGWVSLRVDDRFLWLMTQGSLRLAFLADRPFPARWLALLGRHARNPFAAHLRGARIEGASVLVAGEAVDGLQIRLSRGRTLSMRVWPRPGAIWMTGNGEILARIGRMEGDGLEARPVEPTAGAGAWFRTAASLLADHLRDRATAGLSRGLRDRQDKQRRLVAKLDADLARARETAARRTEADILAANLHRVSVGMDSVRLEDFAGNPVDIPLDPKLDPAVNLDRLYRRAGKAERSVREVDQRVAEAEATFRAVTAAADAPLPTELDAILDLADAHGIDLVPRDKAPRRGPDPERLPYWRYRLADGTEIRVGRSARDNDALLRAHASGKDLWLHAQGVSGSHVLIRRGGREPTPAQIERAARLAAHFSKARTSETVPVIVTERRYVRKPRKAAAGAVVAERARTVFVTPGVPDDVERED